MYQPYRNILIPIDCASDIYRQAELAARHIAAMQGAKATMIASITPSINPVIRARKLRQAENTLQEVTRSLGNYGVRAEYRVIEGDDAALAFLSAARDHSPQYDLLLLKPLNMLPSGSCLAMDGLIDRAHGAPYPMVILGERAALPSDIA